VAGPQYATGVGLVQYGAHALREAREPRVVEAPPRTTSPRIQQPSPRPERRDIIEEPVLEKRGGGKFWNWLRAAF
jgi:cell division protein FtsA